MRKARTTQKVQFLAPDVTTKIIPAPTDGWDAISPLAEMDPKRAPILINWVPRPGFVELRGGSITYANTLDDNAVETLMVRRSSSGERFFAASGETIQEITAGEAGVEVVNSLNSARFQYVNFTPAGAATVIQCVNGIDPLLQFNGSTWSNPSITGLPVGTTTSDFIGITIFKRRIWYVVDQSSMVIFMPTDAIQGAIAGTQDFGALWTKGGYLVAMGSWTIDGGSGPQDYAVFISSRGQATVYAGTDPTSAATWQLVGTFDLSPPIGRRCFLRVGSDLALISLAGVIPISQALPFDPSADRSVAITARIQNQMAIATAQAQNNFGWQLISFPAQQLAVLNVPLTENTQQVQYVMNALTGGWCQFNGWNANCFEIFNDKLYWGGNNGEIREGYVGASDMTDPIAADMQCAFNWMDEPGRNKRMTMIQPMLTLGGNIIPSIAIDTDFMASTAIAPITSFVGGTLWDQGIWDVSGWSSLSINFNQWLSVNAIGKSMAVRMRVNVTGTGNLLGAGIFDVGVFDTATFDGGFSNTLPVLQVNAFSSILEQGGAI